MSNLKILSSFYNEVLKRKQDMQEKQVLFGISPFNAKLNEDYIKTLLA